MMKKILIVNNNLDTGGIQKSLVNLLNSIYDKYDVTLMLFSKSGALLHDVPDDVKIISPKSRYRILGLSKNELKSFPLLFLFKAFLIHYTKIFSRRSAMKVLGLFQRKITGYDVVISYTHLSTHEYFWNGCGDFVLDKTVCQNKICMIHCDYLNSSCMTGKNNKEYAEFDKIACCSDSVKERFIRGTAMDIGKVYTLRNFYDLNIQRLAVDCPYVYDKTYINIVSVARLSTEKGIDRAIDALYDSKRTDIRYFIIGDGPQKNCLVDKVKEHRMDGQVFFLGEQRNPYRYMEGADFLLVPSRHEAAPMVFDEAKFLGLSVITTNTTSAEEIIGNEYGIVCENSVQGIRTVLSELKKYKFGKRVSETNQLQTRQFDEMLKG